MDERTGHWFAVASSRELGKKPLAKTRFGERFVFFRSATGEPVCMPDACPHRGAQLSLGWVEMGHIACPYHGFRFDETGRCVATPCEGDRPISAALQLPTHPVREQYGFIWLYRGHNYDALPALPNLVALDGTHFGEIRAVWQAHFTRALEAQIDYTHLPFVHNTTIGLTMPEAMTVTTRVEGDVVRAWLGSASEPTGQNISLHYPNVWVNEITPKLFIVIAAAPASDGCTELYVRFQHRIVTVPGLRELVSYLGGRWSWVIVRQDKPVVLSQLPLDANDARGDRLVASDGPVAEFRRLRRKHIESAPKAQLRVLRS